jgi:hypothetical protein
MIPNGNADDVIGIRRDYLWHVYDDLLELRGAWAWKRGERAGNGEEYDALCCRIGELGVVLGVPCDA